MKHLLLIIILFILLNTSCKLTADIETAPLILTPEKQIYYIYVCPNCHTEVKILKKDNK